MIHSLGAQIRHVCLNVEINLLEIRFFCLCYLYLLPLNQKLIRTHPPQILLISWSHCDTNQMRVSQFQCEICVMIPGNPTPEAEVSEWDRLYDLQRSFHGLFYFLSLLQAKPSMQIIRHLFCLYFSSLNYLPVMLRQKVLWELLLITTFFLRKHRNMISHSQNWIWWTRRVHD